MNNYLLIGLESLIDHIGCIRDYRTQSCDVSFGGR